VVTCCKIQCLFAAWYTPHYTTHTHTHTLSVCLMWLCPGCARYHKNTTVQDNCCITNVIETPKGTWSTVNQPVKITRWTLSFSYPQTNSVLMLAFWCPFLVYSVKYNCTKEQFVIYSADVCRLSRTTGRIWWAAAENTGPPRVAVVQQTNQCLYWQRMVSVSKQFLLAKWAVIQQTSLSSLNYCSHMNWDYWYTFNCKFTKKSSSEKSF